MIADQIRRRVRAVGKRLVRQGLVHSCVGNISARDGDRIIISATGAMLDQLDGGSLLEIPIGTEPLPWNVSRDTYLHAAIYHATNAGAIVHTHSPYAVAESLGALDPVLDAPDVEGAMVLKGIPVVDSGEPERLAGECVEALRGHPAIIVRGHGVIAVGATVEDAFVMASFVEHACMVRHLARGAVREQAPSR